MEYHAPNPLNTAQWEPTANRWAFQRERGLLMNRLLRVDNFCKLNQTGIKLRTGSWAQTAAGRGHGYGRAVVRLLWNEAESRKHKAPVQRHVKTATRSGTWCQVCFLISVCPVSTIQVVRVFDLQCNRFIDISRLLGIASAIFRSMPLTRQTRHPSLVLNI